MNLDKLKVVNLVGLTREQVYDHQRAVLALTFNEQVSYLEYAIGGFYKTEAEGDNDPAVMNFFDHPDFKTCFELILSRDEEC